MELKLEAQKRDTKDKLTPEYTFGVVYGKGLESRSVKLKKSEFDKAFSAAGESNLIELDIEGEKSNVLIKDVQRHPVKGVVIHVDFYEVNMKEKVTAEIPLEFIGESKAVKELGGILIKEAHEIKVECLPNDLIDHIDVDISNLATMDDVIKVSDLNIPKTMEIMDEDDSIVAMISEPKVEEEPEPEVTEEVAEGGEKKEGEAKDGAETGEGEKKEGEKKAE